MIIGPFALLPGQLAVSNAPIEEWEKYLPTLFAMQKYVPWWIGDSVVFGEARFGDDFWQAVPMDASEKLTQRFGGVSRKIPAEDRVLGLSWTHHVTALRIQHPKLRSALLRRAERDGLDTEAFGKLVRETVQ